MPPKRQRSSSTSQSLPPNKKRAALSMNNVPDNSPPPPPLVDVPKIPTADVEAKLRIDFERQMFNDVHCAQQNITVVPFNFDRAAAGKRQLKAAVTSMKDNPINWDGDYPRCIRSIDGVDLVWLIPKMLRGKARDIFYAQLMDLGSTVKLSSCAGADKKTDNSKAFIELKGGLVGLFKLVKYWTPVGHPDAEPTVAAHIIKNGKTFSRALKYIEETRLLSHRINAFLENIDLHYYAALCSLRKAIENDLTFAKVLGVDDPFQGEGREIMFNRQTPLHRDNSDPKRGWAVLVAGGDFEGGGINLPEINFTSRFDAGDLVGLRGKILKHRVLEFTGRQRISVAHFTHQSIWARYGMTPPLTRHEQQEET